MHHESGRLFLPSTTHVVSSFFKGHACRHRLDGLQRLTERLRASHALRTCTRGLSLSLSASQSRGRWFRKRDRENLLSKSPEQ